MVSVIKLDDLLAKVAAPYPSLDVRLSEGISPATDRMRDGSNPTGLGSGRTPSSKIAASTTMSFAGATWTLSASPRDEFFLPSQKVMPFLVFGSACSSA